MLKKITIMTAILAAACMLACLAMTPFVARQAGNGIIHATNNYAKYETRLESQLESCDTLSINTDKYNYELYRSSDEALRVESNDISLGTIRMDVAASGSTAILNVYQVRDDEFPAIFSKKVMQEISGWYENFPANTVRVYLPASIAQVTFNNEVWSIRPHGDIGWSMVQEYSRDPLPDDPYSLPHRSGDDDWEEDFAQRLTDNTVNMVVDAVYEVFVQFTATTQQIDRLSALGAEYTDALELYEAGSINEKQARDLLYAVVTKTEDVISEIDRDNRSRRDYGDVRVGDVEDMLEDVADHNLALAGIKLADMELSGGSITGDQHSRLVREYQSKLISSEDGLAHQVLEQGIANALQDAFSITLPMFYRGGASPLS